MTALRHLALSYQISCAALTKIVKFWAHHWRDLVPGSPSKIIFAQGAEVPRKVFVGTMDTYQDTYQEEGVCKFVGKIEFVINRWR